jgi:MerR family mercuric resistance operon transcriptional regulator
MNERTPTLTIGRLAETAGVHVETIRFYQRKGLMQEPDRPLGGIRHYTGTDLARVRFIKSAQRLGFSLEEIAELLRLEDGTHCDEARRLADHKLEDVRGKLVNLKRIETALCNLVSACHTRKKNVSCPLIASLQQDMRSSEVAKKKR